MKQTMTTWQVADALKRDHYAAWSFAGAKAIAEYLEQEEETCGEMEFDLVAIRCDFSEYGSAREAAKNYSWVAPQRHAGEGDDDFENRIEGDAAEYLQENTVLIAHAGGIVIKNF